MNYQEKREIENAILDYAKIKSGERYKHAFAFGMLVVMLNDEQLTYLKNYVDKCVSEL